LVCVTLVAKLGVGTSHGLLISVLFFSWILGIPTMQFWPPCCHFGTQKKGVRGWNVCSIRTRYRWPWSNTLASGDERASYILPCSQPNTDISSASTDTYRHSADESWNTTVSIWSYTNGTSSFAIPKWFDCMVLLSNTTNFPGSTSAWNAFFICGQ
jgi:hypothetical protein